MPKFDLVYAGHMLDTAREALDLVRGKSRAEVVHDYMHVDLDVVWDVVTNDLSTLVAQLEQFEAEP